MIAVGALAAFIVALALHVVGGRSGGYWVDAALLGFIFLSTALMVPVPLPWRRAP